MGDIPVSRESQQKLKYSNKIGFGSSCEEYFVQVEGFARTSEQQIESSRRSEATRKCARLSREVSQLHERMQTHTVQVDTPAHRVRYNGVDVVVEEKIASAKSCGLCGENSLDRRGSLQSPRQCVYKSIKSIMQSYRVEDSECNSRLPTTDRNNLRSQKSMCSSRQTVKHQQLKRQKEQFENSKIMPRSSMYGNKWQQESQEVEWKKHAIIHFANEICLSKEQVPECAP